MKKRTEQEISAAVEELLNKMTLKEKIGQLNMRSMGDTSELGLEYANNVDEKIREGLVGSVIQNANDYSERAYAMQKLAVEESRLKIPLLFNSDVIHGFETVFPTPLAWSCSFDPDLIRKACRACAEEATCVGINYTNTPMVDIARDPRWGRVTEGAGEDPYLGGEVGKAQIEGFQGEALDTGDTMIATLKHYIGYGAAEGGRDYNNCEISDSTLRNIYLLPFKAGVEAGAGSVMTSFNTINNVPLTGNKKLLKDLLREELGFEGLLLSDANSLYELIPQGVAEGPVEAAEQAMNATLDIEMGSGCYELAIAGLIQAGKLKEEQIDDCVRRILTMKFRSGVMDDPFLYFNKERGNEVIFCEKHLELSRELARESIVMTKNNGILPISIEKKIALVGPKGNSKDMLGAWHASRRGEDTITILEGLEKAGYTVACEAGCELETELPGGIEAAVKAAQHADVVLLALGESSGMSGEAASKQNLNLPEAQLKLAEAVKQTGKPVVLLLSSGRPLILNWFQENADGILLTWFLGSMAGYAISDILSGNYNPSGKTSVSFPRNVGQIPVFYNYLSTGKPMQEANPDWRFACCYIDGTKEPLYPFGFGLSYSVFQYGAVELSSAELKSGGKITAEVEITNVSSIDGVETVQLYLRDLVASVARPVKELKGFQRVKIKAGETKRVIFEIREEMLKYYNIENQYVADSGKFHVWIGSDSTVKEAVEFCFVK